MVKYCSKECQQAHWTAGGHKQVSEAAREDGDDGSARSPQPIDDQHYVFQPFTHTARVNELAGMPDPCGEIVRRNLREHWLRHAR